MGPVDWPAIIREYGPVVWKTAYRLLSDHTDAADCFQETFLDALRICRQEKVANWPGLLQRIATSRAVDQLRKRRRSSALFRGEVNPDTTLGSSTPLHNIEASELNHRLLSALGELPSPMAEVFCLRFLAELSYQEISLQMGMSSEAVATALHRARRRLAELLVDRTLIRNQRR